MAKQVILQCIVCKRYKANPNETPTQDWIKCTAVFKVTGVDLAGPMYLKSGTKAWIVLFTFAVYHAIHLELV